MVTFENVCRGHTKRQVLIKKCASSVCLSPLFVSYFWSNYDGPRTKVFSNRPLFGFFRGGQYACQSSLKGIVVRDLCLEIVHDMAYL